MAAKKDSGAQDLTVRPPHRADARRNYEALLAAAREAFAERGADAPLEEIARRAGVGIGTLYRNFPTRHHLFHSVYASELDEVCQAAAQVAELPPWEALVTWIHRFSSYVETKRALFEALNRDSEMFRSSRQRILEAAGPLYARAQQAGQVRTDADFDDLLRMLGALLSGTFVDKAQRERVLSIALSGLRPTC